ncbi:hypothetical protein LTR53_006003 [Teratosphaeriaceae sp. CCFEE 6253]|nr:hypothetical protein LTR53_006003 [Teratosphaeriaceae sp. CCFEE 6253]
MPGKGKKFNKKKMAENTMTAAEKAINNAFEAGELGLTTSETLRDVVILGRRFARTERTRVAGQWSVLAVRDSRSTRCNTEPGLLTTRCASDYFHRLDKQGVAICKACLYAVWPDQISAHPRQKHKLLRDEVRAVATEVATWRLFASSNAFELAREGQQALPYPAYSHGWAPLPAPASTLSWSASHHRGHLGRIEAEEYRQQRADASSSACCQRLFPVGKSSGYFEVSLGDAEPSRAEAEAEGEPTNLASIVRGELAALEEAQHESAQVFRGFESAKEVSPRLELHTLAGISQGTPPRRCRQAGSACVSESEPALSTLVDSLERLVKEARQSVRNDSVNMFDQARINSCLQRPRAADRPLMVKLQKSRI